MIIKSHTTSIAIALLSAMLAACGGSSSSSGDETNPGDNEGDGFVVDPASSFSGSYQYFGYVDITNDSFQDRVNHDSNFFRMVSAATTQTFKTVPPPADQCRLRITDSIPTDSAAIGFPSEPFELVSAGETLSLSSSGSTYADVSFSTSRFEIGPYPAPDELTLDLAGMEFPAFANVSIPPTASASNFQSSTGNSITPASVITWTPAGAADNSIYMEVVDFQNGLVVDLECRMIDDGSFELPDDVKTALSNALGDYTLDRPMQVVKAMNVVTQGDALLVVSRLQE